MSKEPTYEELAQQLDGWINHARKVDEQILRVRVLHKPVDSGTPLILGKICQECSVPSERFTFYPCETIKELAKDPQ